MSRRKPKSLMFIQDFGTYTNELLVFVGENNKKEVFKFLKKEKIHVPIAKWVLTDYDGWVKHLDKGNKAQVIVNDEFKVAVLMLLPLDDKWDYWETLMHETHHVVQDFAKHKGMFDEPEGQAYLQEYLFRSIRRKLMGFDK